MRTHARSPFLVQIASLAIAAAACHRASGPSNPAAPSQLAAASFMPGAVRATWAPASGATGYAVYVAQAGAPEVRFDVVAPPWTATDLVPGADYQVAVASRRGDWESPRSAPVSVSARPLAALTVDGATANAISLSWSAVSDGAYVVYRSLSSPVTPATADAIAAALPAAEDAGLQPNTTYYYAVAAIVDGVESALGQEVSATTAPAAPAVSSAVGGDRRATLAWDASPGAELYTLGCGTSPGLPLSAQLSMATTATSAELGGLSPGTAYWCSITAAGPAGTGGTSPEVEILTLPATPTGLLAASGSGELWASWNAAAGATGYVVSWRAGNAAATEVTVQGTSWSVDGAVPGETYRVAVAAVSEAGRSAFTAEVQAIGAAAPTPAVSAKSDTSVTLAWDTVTGATGYVLLRSETTPVDPLVALPIPTADTSAVDASAQPDHTYFYAVAVVIAGVETAPGGSIEVRTLPQAPTLAAAATRGAVILRWTDANQAVGYDVYWSDSGPVTDSSPVLGGVTSPHEQAGLVPGATYRYRVVAIGNGGRSALSEEVSAVPAAFEKVATATTTAGVTGFAEGIPAVDGGLEVFPGQANAWDVQPDLSVSSAGFAEGPFAGALLLRVGHLDAWPVGFDYVKASEPTLTPFPYDLAFSELTFLTPTYAVADGVRPAELSTGTSLGLAPLAGARSAFLDGTSGSRLQQELDLSAATAPVAVSWQHAFEPAASVFSGAPAPAFDVVLRALDGSPLATLHHAAAAGATPPGGLSADLSAWIGQRVVLSFEVSSGAPGYAIVDEVALSSGAAVVSNGGFESGTIAAGDAGWTAATAGEPRNLSGATRTLCVVPAPAGAPCGAQLVVRRSFFSPPTARWARVVDVFENLGTTAISTHAVYTSVLASSGSEALYSPVAGALAGYDLSSSRTRDFGLVYGTGTALFRSATATAVASGAPDGDGVVYMVHPLTVPPGGRVALAHFLVISGDAAGRTGATMASVEDDLRAIVAGYAAPLDTTYRDWMPAGEAPLVVNF